MDRSIWRAVTFLALSGVWSGLLCGQSSLIFPRLSFEQDTLIGVAVLNPNSEAALVRFAAYDATGALIQAAGFSNPREIQIGAGRQYGEVTASLFGKLSMDRVAWLEATSSSPNLTGFFLFLEFPGFGFLDGADLPSPGKHLVLPEFRLESGFSTEFHLINPGTVPATLRLSLEGNGELLQSDPLTLPPHGVVRLNLRDEFAELETAAPRASPADPPILRIFSTEPVAGFAFIRQQGADLLGINAVAEEDPLNRLYFPQMAVGAVISTELSLQNLTDEETLVTLTAHREDGQLFGAGEVFSNPVSLTFSAKQARRIDLSEVFGFVGSETRQGWLEVASVTKALQGALTYAITGTGSMAAVSTTRQGSRNAAFSHIATSAGFFTGIALLNPSTLAADVRIVAISQNGTILGTSTLTLLPGERISQLLGLELIPQAANQAGGAVLVRSSLPIFMTSLFGLSQGSGNLANIPAQAIPATFRPDMGLPQARVSPALAAVEPGGNLLFALQTLNAAPRWSVNGMPGGGEQSGTINSSGLYQAPAASPRRLPVLVTAEAENQEASASIDVLSPEVLFEGPGIVQSLAFVESLSRLFAAELGLTTTAGLNTPIGIGSVIVDVTGGERRQVLQLPGEEVAKILPFLDTDGMESLLLAGRSGGRIYRLTLESPPRLLEVASGLLRPTALALDAAGDLLVAEEDRLSRIPASRLSGNAIAAQGTTGAVPLLEGISPRGIAVDPCTGDVLFSDARGQVLRSLAADTGNIASLAQLTRPTQVLALLRTGVSCPDALHVFVTEPEIGQVTRVVPSVGSMLPYVIAPDTRDIAFRHLAGPQADDDLLFTAFLTYGSANTIPLEIPAEPDGVGRIVRLPIADLYQAAAPNPPARAQCTAVVDIPDPVLEGRLRSLFPDLGPGEPLTCGLAAGTPESSISLENLDIQEIKGIEAFVNLQELFLACNQISDLTPLSGLTQLEVLDLTENGNGISNLTDLSELKNLRSLTLSFNSIMDLAPLSRLTNLEVLRLDENPISDITALVNNPGLGQGDILILDGTFLNAGDCPQIRALSARGVMIDIAQQLCP